MLTRSETERGTEGMIGEGGNDKREGETEEEQKRMEEISEKGRMISGRKKTEDSRGERDARQAQCREGQASLRVS